MGKSQYIKNEEKKHIKELVLHVLISSEFRPHFYDVIVAVEAVVNWRRRYVAHSFLSFLKPVQVNEALTRYTCT